MIKHSKPGDPRKAFLINEVSKKINAIYDELIENFKSGDFSEYGSQFFFSNGVYFKVPAGKVSIVFQHVKTSPLGTEKFMGRIVFVFEDPLIGEDIPIYAIQFDETGSVYSSDMLDEYLESGFNGKRLNDAAMNRIVLHLNVAIIEHNTRQTIK